jgi:simple sugar transport system ATP-binding protein
MSQNFLVMKGVNKHFGGGVHALKDVDFELKKGEIHCLVGQNGSGKSTLIKIISGVIKPDPGSYIEILGKEVTSFSSHYSMESGIRVIYQDLSLFPNLTVAENIAFDINIENKAGNISWKQIYENAAKALEKIQVDLDLDIAVERLSIADRQLVAIARALATNAKLIIMDEPTSSLTRKEVDILFAIIKDLQSKGMTVMFVSHRLDEVMEIAERVSVIRDGVFRGTVKKSEIDDAKLVYMISGQNIRHEQRLAKASAETLLEVRNLCREGQYENISLKLNKGECLGIIGLLGSGRTELALSIFGMNPPDSGEIMVEGERKDFKTNQDAVKSRIGYVPEDRLLQGLVLDQPIESNISIAISDRLKNKLGLIDNKKKRQIALNWIEKLNIFSAVPDVNASAMSGGNQQKIVISKWLATEPRILILDQPTNGIDVAAKDAIYAIIHELAQDGLGIILISDEVPEIYYNCSRALIMHKGAIRQEVDTTKITEEEFYKNVLYAQ